MEKSECSYSLFAVFVFVFIFFSEIKKIKRKEYDRNNNDILALVLKFVLKCNSYLGSYIYIRKYR